ncbi:hypothetical protein DFJ74DRAFT_707656 [Hyaloraphidium curvatum]|nr:hypothetical protein DFJ74DRAFT_707656 [Hyaloraphidium curvatum]
MFGDLNSRYWTLTLLLLASALRGHPSGSGFSGPLALVAVQTVHYALRTDSPTSFPVQVRIAYFATMLAGTWAPLRFLHWIQLIGTTAAVTVDYCLMARIVSLMPWNREEALTGGMVVRRIFSWPVRGSIVGGGKPGKEC